MSQVVAGGDSSAGPGSGAANNSLTVDDIFSILQRLTPEQLEELRLKLNWTTDQVYELYKMHVRSYEESLMVYDEYRLHKALLLYVPPILIILGTFGNIFSFIILKRKAMLKFSTYFYLMILAIADTLVLYVGLLRLWIGELTGFDLRDQSDWACKITTVVGYTISDFSVWLIIAVTTERYIVVCHPLKANAMCNTRRARRVILALLAGLLVLNLHFFWTVEIVHFKHGSDKIPSCSGGKWFETLIEDAWPWVDAFVYSFIPFVVILVLNGLIIRQVILARRHRQELRSDQVYEQRRPSHEGNTRLTVMLLTISFAFLLTTLPMNVTSIAAAFLNPYRSDLAQVSKFKLARTITELLMYVNHSMNFFLYCATGQKFRHQLVWMICYAKRTSTHFSWGSEHSGQGTTRMESIRNGKSLVCRRSDAGTEMYNVTVKSGMYTPLKYNTVNKEDLN